MPRHSRALFVTLLVTTAFAGCMRDSRRETSESAGAAEASTSTTAQTTGAAMEDQLRRLLLERQQILEGIAENARRYVDAGRMDASEYAELRKAALRARLDLCDTQAERIEIRREIVALDREAEAWMKRRAASGRTTEGELGKARLARIESEIDLLKEQLNK